MCIRDRSKGALPLLFSGCCFGLLWLGPPAGIFPARLPRNRLRPEISPYRARSRSDKNAAVLTLQNTQRKDRRLDVYKRQAWSRAGRNG